MHEFTLAAKPDGTDRLHRVTCPTLTGPRDSRLEVTLAEGARLVENGTVDLCPTCKPLER